MAINKNSNIYTVTFTILMVIVVGSVLAFLSESLQPIQDKNADIKKKMDILNSIDISNVTRKNAEELYDQYILSDKSYVINFDGQIIEGLNPFDLNIRDEFRDKDIDITNRKYPLYLASKNDSLFYIVPMVGTGLWDAIWGYIAVSEDKKTISGAVFDHQGETPGLGAEIKTKKFTNGYKGESISKNGSYKKIVVVKDKSGKGINYKVDGITGGTITSKGVEEMVDRTMKVYVKHFKKN